MPRSRSAKAEAGPVAIVIEVDRYEGVPGYESWWDVAVAEVSDVESVRAARAGYDAARKERRSHV